MSAFNKCPNTSITLFAKTDKGFIFYMPRCNTWKCEYCSEQLKKQWSWRIAKATELGIKHRGWQPAFVTLTSHEKLKNIDQCLHVFSDGWKKIQAKWRYRYPDFAYAMVAELHKSRKRVHWHILASHAPSERDMKKWARGAGLGYQVKVEPIETATDAGAVAFYVAKYISKSIEDDYKLSDKWASRRRVNTSRNFPTLEELNNSESELAWHIYNATSGMTMALELMAMIDQGVDVKLIGHFDDDFKQMIEDEKILRKD
jgi:hypothetical protein